MRRLLALPALALTLPLFAGSAPAQLPAPGQPGDTAFGEGHVLETDFEFHSQAGPNGEGAVGTLVTHGYLEFTASLTCSTVKGNTAVGGYLVKTGKHAGEGFLSASVDNGPPVDGQPVDETLYSGYLPEPPVNCPAPGDPPPDDFRSTGGGPFTRGDWTLVNSNEQLPEGTPSARIAAMRTWVRPDRTVVVRARVCGRPGMALLRLQARTEWLRHDARCATHEIAQPLRRRSGGYKIKLRARTTGRRWSRPVARIAGARS
jgi:hypothetical protein